MRALERKALRDLGRLKGQVATISLVLGCGIMAMIMMRSVIDSLAASRDGYYAEYRFADVFARLERAPQPIAERIGRIPGVAQVDTRLVEEIMVSLPGKAEAIPGRIISVPDLGPPALNGVKLTAGRWPEATGDQVLLLQPFADGHRLGPGDRLPVVLDGTLRSLDIAGLAMAPEYIFAAAPGEAVAHKTRFAVIWMPRSRLAPALQMEGAFKDLSIALQPGATIAAVIDQVDRELEPYGGLHAIPRRRSSRTRCWSGSSSSSKVWR
jgi:putative ABC transport system permease protein